MSWLLPEALPERSTEDSICCFLSENEEHGKGAQLGYALETRAFSPKVVVEELLVITQTEDATRYRGKRLNA